MTQDSEVENWETQVMLLSVEIMEANPEDVCLRVFSSKDLIDEAKQTLHNNFKVKDLGKLKYFLGIEVLRSQKGILLNQRKYTLELVSDVGLSGTKPVFTPLEANINLTTAEYDKLTGYTDDPLLEDISSYQNLVKKLIYLTITKPDICFTVQVLSQFMQQPKRSYWDASLRVTKYIKGCSDLGIFMPKNSTIQLTAFCDADWAACPKTRCSVTVYAIKLGDSLISWKSKK
ncbi:uncharacterized mitochondrial protein AtMg00810-like [Nicotiana sylvestris]|uniref:uncharacterized mitochondrial protein AtMg00810-like n=1 Tax=Nicotiana sylvestris TaxID=4096 RepID=UPI00388CDB34